MRIKICDSWGRDKLVSSDLRQPAVPGIRRPSIRESLGNLKLLSDLSLYEKVFMSYLIYFILFKVKVFERPLV